MSLRIHGNRLLKTLDSAETRPTASKVRQALFNIWQGTVDDCRWLDLCAGSGAMGAEALCRGAREVVAVELTPESIAVIKQNWQQVAHADQKWQVHRGDVVKQLSRLREPFDRIYFDPPYESDLYTPVLRSIATHNILSLEGEMAVEHNSHRKLGDLPGLTVCRYKAYGKTALTFYRRSIQVETPV
jgi:16S rRNA (guanine966-N2)-methyltransferase